MNTAICEDPEIKERIIQLRSEQETKAQDAARRKIRRSQSSNSRTQSIRRTSHRDKGLTSKKDAADEAQMLMAREINIKVSEPFQIPLNSKRALSYMCTHRRVRGTDRL